MNWDEKHSNCISPDSPSTAHYFNCELCCSAKRAQKLQRAPSSNAEGDGSLGCVESINAHSLQTSESHVLVAWMVSPADSGNNLIIAVLSGASENRLEPTGFPFMLEKKRHHLRQNLLLHAVFFFTPPPNKLLSVTANVQVRFFFSQLHHVKVQTHQRVLFRGC